MRSGRAWAIGLAAAIAVGVVFRLAWLEDAEYKADEVWTFQHVQAFWQTHELPAVGMPASVGVPNSGLSIWVFIALSALVPIDTPLPLTRAVELMNVSAILLLLSFALRGVSRSEREPWLWSVALTAVNPFAVLFSRKIWPPDTLLLFTVSMLAAWWHRRRWWGGFLWGMFGAVLGQIQLVGFLFAAMFVLCTMLLDRRSVHWFAWFAGSVLGSLPMLPWLAELLMMLAERVSSTSATALPASPHLMTADIGLFLPRFVLYWLNMMLGSGLDYSLGDNYPAFLAFPSHTYGVAGLVAGAIAIFTVVVVRLCRRLYAARLPHIAGILDASSSTGLALCAGFAAYGLLLTVVTANTLSLYYLVVPFPLPWVSLACCVAAGSSEDARSVANGRRLLSALVLLQACITLMFLTYVHETQVIHGDYGTAYRAQDHGKP